MSGKQGNRIQNAVRPTWLLICLLLPLVAAAQPEDSLPVISFPDVLISSPVPLMRGPGIRELKPSCPTGTDMFPSPGEFLLTVPAAYVKAYQAGGLQTVALRGTGASHTQVFWKGVPINSPMLGQSDLGLGMAGLQGSPRILLGGSSLLAGSGGLGGAFLWEDRESANEKIVAELEGGSFGTFRAMLTAPSYRLGKGKRWTGSSGAGFFRSENDFSFHNISLPNAPLERLPNARVGQAGFAQSFHLTGENGAKTSLDAYLQAAERQLPPTMLSSNAQESQEDAGMRIRLGHTRNLGKWQMEAFAAGITDHMRYANPVAGILSDARFVRSNAELNMSKPRWNRRLHWQGWGLRWTRDFVFSENLPPGLKQDVLSVKTAFEGKLLQKGAWMLILREEYNGNRLSSPMFSLGFDRPFAKGAHNLGLNLAHNQHFPTLNDRYWQPGGNPGLLPEDAWSADIVLDGSLAKQEGRSLHYSLSAQAQRVDNWIQWQPTSSNIWTPENLSRVWIQGFEAALNGQYALHSLRCKFSLDYALTRAVNQRATVAGDSSVGKQLIYIPLHQFKPRLEVSLRQWAFHANAHVIGRRFTTRDNSAWLPGFATIDLQLERSFELGFGLLKAQLVASNISNASYQTVAWRPMPGRGFSLRLHFEWR